MGACSTKEQTSNTSKNYDHAEEKNKTDSKAADIENSSELFAEIEETYRKDGFKRAFYCVNSSLVRSVQVLCQTTLFTLPIVLISESMGSRNRIYGEVFKVSNYSPIFSLSLRLQ